MKKTSMPTQPAQNSLLEIHSRFLKLPISFRDRVCEECAWSVPTFYRKMRLRKGTILELSNAENKAISTVAKDMLGELSIEISKF